MSERIARLCDIEDSRTICDQLAVGKCSLCERDCCTRHRSSVSLTVTVGLDPHAGAGLRPVLGEIDRRLCDPCHSILRALPKDSLGGEDWDASVLAAVRALVSAQKLKESA